MQKFLYRSLFAVFCAMLLAVTASGQTCAPTASNGGPYCPGSTISLFATSTDPTATFAWTGPNNFTSNAQNPTIPNADPAINAGAYTVTVNGVNGCTGTATTNVTVGPPPSTITGAPTWVTTTSTGKTASGPDGVASYSWEIVNGQITDGQAAKVVAFTAGSVGTLTLKLTTTWDSAKCSSQSSQNVEVDAQPTINITGNSAQPGAKGTLTQIPFNISLSNPSTQMVSVDYYTSNQTAVAGKDYQATSGTVVFGPLETSKTVYANIYGTSTNPQKTFLMSLKNPMNATIQTVNGWPVRGKGTILAK